jgi:hypothetical protein
LIKLQVFFLLLVFQQAKRLERARIPLQAMTIDHVHDFGRKPDRRSKIIVI